MTGLQGKAAILVLQLLISALASVGQDSRPLRTRIPKADAKKYRGIQDARDWKNPYLVVYRDGIVIVGVTASEHPIAVDSVHSVLDGLPDSAWPFGLIAAVQDVGPEGHGDSPRIEANRARLLKLLADLGIPVDLWPA